MRYSIHVFVVASSAAAIFCGCQHTQPPESRSILSKTFFGIGFEPERSMRRQGLAVKASRINDGATDLVENCYWHSWQGVVNLPNDTNACMTVSKVIRDELNRTLRADCEDELTTKGYNLQAGKPFWGSLHHDEAGARVDVRVWLIPHEGTSNLSYVIYLRAADLPK